MESQNKKGILTDTFHCFIHSDGHKIKKIALVVVLMVLILVVVVVLRMVGVWVEVARGLG